MNDSITIYNLIGNLLYMTHDNIVNLMVVVLIIIIIIRVGLKSTCVSVLDVEKYY